MLSKISTFLFSEQEFLVFFVLKEPQHQRWLLCDSFSGFAPALPKEPLPRLEVHSMGLDYLWSYIYKSVSPLDPE